MIGRGGFGVVYRGHQPDLGRDVAVKVLSAPGADERSVQLWRREVTAMGRLSNHPNIVAAFSAGVTDAGYPYLVMPYVPGGSLHDRIHAQGALPPSDVARIGARVAAGLAAAHAAGVLHRDVKPANVLMSEYGEPQITDFGIARLVDAATTTTGSVRATIGYAAPEVLGGDTATPAADVYGLGATLHAALAGRAPFAGTDGESFAARIGRVMTQPPPDLRPLGVSPALAEVVEAALAKDPGDRPQTANELRRRLEGLSPVALAAVAPSVAPAEATEPVASPPPAPPPSEATSVAASEPAGPDGPDPSRRRAVLVVAAVAALALLAGGAAWALTRGGADDSDVASGPSTTATTEGSTITTEETTPPPSTSSTVAPTTTEESTTTTEEPTTTEETTTTEAPTTTEETSEEISERDLRGALDDYYSLVDRGELEEAYALLSPRYQATQPFAGSYSEFWNGIRSVAVRGRPDVDVETMTVEASLRFVRNDGSTSDDDAVLTYVTNADGTLLIDTYSAA